MKPRWTRFRKKRKQTDPEGVAGGLAGFSATCGATCCWRPATAASRMKKPALDERAFCMSGAPGANQDRPETLCWRGFAVFGALLLWSSYDGIHRGRRS